MLTRILLITALVLSGCGGKSASGGGGSPSGGGGGGSGGGGGGGGTGGSSGGSGGIAGVSPGSPATGLSYASGDATSKYAIYIPPGYTGAPIGVVIALHGVEGTSTPTGWFQVCVYYANLDRFIVVAPYGDTTDGGSGAWSQPFAKEIWDLVRSKYNVDNNKQYMAAISGGCYPGIWLALASAPSTYTNYQGQTVESGFQSQFAAVGFCAPAYSPSSGDYGAMQAMNASTLGFTPAMWIDYGQNSSDGTRASQLESWANAHGYSPVTKVMRPGEGHAPNPPYA